MGIIPAYLTFYLTFLAVALLLQSSHGFDADAATAAAVLGMGILKGVNINFFSKFKRIYKLVNKN